MNGRDDPDDLGPAERDTALAAEFALGLLDPVEHAACVAREDVDRGFAAEVARWRVDFGELDDGFAPAAAPAGLRTRIEARLFPAAARPSLVARLWSSTGVWRSATGLAVLALVLILQWPEPTPEAPAARLVSALAPATATGTEVLAVYDPETDAISLNRVAGAAAPGRVIELWLIPEGSAPISLGVLPADAAARVDVPPELAGQFAAGALLAVSDEPPGGSTTGAPTGDVLAAGPLIEI